MLSFPLFRSSCFGVVRAMCADSIFRLSLCNSNEKKHSTQSRHKKKNTSLKRALNALRKRVVGLRRLSKKQRQRQQQRVVAFEKTFSFVRTRRDFFVEEGGEPRAYTRALLKRERERRNFQR